MPVYQFQHPGLKQVWKKIPKGCRNIMNPKKIPELKK
jgi:hypothetical protein